MRHIFRALVVLVNRAALAHYSSIKRLGFGYCLTALLAHYSLTDGAVLLHSVPGCKSICVANRS
jgi:hypothetical protein